MDITWSKLVIWVDDEPNLLNAEMYDLADNGFETKPFISVSQAYDWIIENGEFIVGVRGLLIDAMMPSRMDARFTSPTGLPAGAILCQLMQGAPHWDRIKSRVLLYTRLPKGPTFDLVHDFAAQAGIRLIQKTSGSRIARILLDHNANPDKTQL